MAKRKAALIGGMLAFLFLSCTTAWAQIYRWDNGQLIPGTAGITPGPGVNLSNMTLQYANLQSDNLSSANFRYSDLSFAELNGATLTGADYAIWAANYGATNAVWTQGDFNGDGQVNGADYAIWGANYGASWQP